MKNFIWYCCLAIGSFLPALYVIYKKRKVNSVSTMIVFYLFATGITWVGEFTVLGVFNSYAYKTDLLTSPWAQNLIGHLLLNTTMYPAAAVIMVSYSLRYRWTFVVTAIFVLIEYLFYRLGLYDHHWWKYYMSVITVFLFILISRTWFYKMNQDRRGVTRATVFFFVAMVIIHYPAPVLLLLGKFQYRMDFIDKLVNDLYRTSIIITFIYHLLESFFLVYVACILKKRIWKVLPFILSPAVQILFVRFNILIIKGEWKLIYTIMIYEFFIALFFLVEKYTLKPFPEKLNLENNPNLVIENKKY